MLFINLYINKLLKKISINNNFLKKKKKVNKYNLLSKFLIYITKYKT